MSAVTPPVASLLVVDDSSVQRAHTVAACRAIGVPMVYEAGSGAEALTLLELLVLPPDLLLIDLEMPGMDGIELIQHLHGRSRHASIPLVVASGREPALIHAVETMARNLGLAVLGGLQKPLSPQALTAALGRIGQADGRHAPRDGTQTTVCAEALAGALDAGEIGVHFQPKVDMATGLARGVEALARWPKPEGGFVPPDVFVALAEQKGLIHQLTLQVLKQALAQTAAWNARGLKLSMAVNLSPRLLDRPSLVEEVVELVAVHGLRTEQVVLEITESSVVENMGAALGVLARLRLKGFGLSIDDYGTGFASMQQLARIPFTELKIDRSFVHGATQREHLRVILQSALEMSRRLGLVTVAEGIETLDDWRLLQSLGCMVGQGYLIGRPMPAADLPGWLKQHQRALGELRLDGAAKAQP